jgi:hypothetical protein
MSFKFNDVVGKVNWWCMLTDLTPEEQVILYRIHSASSLEQVMSLIADLERGRERGPVGPPL